MPFPRNVEDLVQQVIAEESALPPTQRTIARSVFHVEHGTRLTDSQEAIVTRNRYALVRVETAFGACAFERTPSACDFPDWSGRSILDILRSAPAPVRMAALDAWFAHRQPHRTADNARVFELPTGTPMERATARDRAIVDLTCPSPGSRTAVIGVVAPMVSELQQRGAVPVLCDRNVSSCNGLPVHSDIQAVLPHADAVLATGMTISDGSFDVIRQHCLRSAIPLTIYAQSGSAVIREFLGHGVSALSAEHFPFSQFSADQTPVYLYQ